MSRKILRSDMESGTDIAERTGTITWFGMLLTGIYNVIGGPVLCVIFKNILLLFLWAVSGWLFTAFIIRFFHMAYLIAREEELKKRHNEEEMKNEKTDDCRS